MNHLKTAAMALIVVFTVAACQREPVDSEPVATSPVADTLFYNGRIYTANPSQPWASALAVREGRIVYVGDDGGAASVVADGTERIDLGGAMLMPGINDGHSHPSSGGIKTLYHCVFSPADPANVFAGKLRDCVEKNPDASWIVGGQWASDFFNDSDIGSPREFLDDISADKVILLSDDTGHNAWTNSRGLELAGVTADTPDPDGGAYIRDEDGAPNGLLYENAARVLEKLQPPYSLDELAAAISEAVAQANSFGLTGLNEAYGSSDLLEAYAKLDREGAITLHMSVNHQTPWGKRDEELIDVEEFIGLREKFQLQRVDTNRVKIFLDGVPTAQRTAVMLEEYLTDDHHPEATRGILLVAEKVLVQDVVALDRAGFTIKIHAAGDGSVRVALDALQAAREANGDSGLRHEIAHAGFIDPVDLPRFAALNVTADLSPPLWFESGVTGSLRSALGPRAEEYFPVKDLLDSGANVLLGSDWPSISENLNPWASIEALVTRRNPFTDAEKTYWPEQAISLEQALDIVTRHGARALSLEHVTGSIEVGKSADFIVLDRNLFEIPVEQISETQVQQTWFEGRPVYTR